MFKTSDSEDDAPGGSGDRMSMLARARREDISATFDEEIDHFRKRKREPSVSESDSDADKDNALDEPAAKKPMTAAETMMAKMGYTEGKGLGKAGQGRVEPVGLSTQRGRVGLGHESSKVLARDFNVTWDESVEDKSIHENVEWLEPCEDEIREAAAAECEANNWIQLGKEKLKIDDEVEFCSPEKLDSMLKAKDVFDTLNDRELREARTRANPYETIGGAFFQNRAAMKTANMDKVFKWIFSGENEQTLLKKNPVEPGHLPTNTDREAPIFYFADVCAGPGGFSEYMLWRKGFYNTKGFGFTLKGKDDFKLGKFTASSAHFFEPFYGTNDNGDVMNPDNIDSLQEFIKNGTNGVGVDLMMADGGFSVEGQENLQEILSKRLYLCQLLVSLCIVKDGGNFFCKLFDIFTPFSAGLCYLMYMCYDEVSLHKPHTSRPANSERYIICKGLRKEYSDRIRDYLKGVNRKLDGFKKAKSTDDVTDVVPLDVMRDNEAFFRYLVRHNERMCIRQTTYLQKYLKFSKNQLLLDKDQGNLREECLKYWMVPNRNRGKDRDQQRSGLNPYEALGKFCTKVLGDDDLSMRMPFFTSDVLGNPTDKQLKHAEYQFTLLAERAGTQPKLLVSAGDAVFIYAGRWNRFDNSEMRIPDKTILLVEETYAYEYHNSRLEQKHQVIRIVDAAVLHGDDVSMLSYVHRMKAAEKFCKALKLVKPVIKTGWGNRERTMRPRTLVTAKLWCPDDFIQLRHELKRTINKGSEMLTIEENNVVYLCQAIRFARILPANWKMGWSRSQSMKYAFQQGLQSIFEKDFEAKDLCASFWDNCLMKKRRPQDNKVEPMMQCLWKLDNSLEDNYGPRVVLEDPDHKSGPTFESLMTIIATNEQGAGKM